jgi:FKBP-type peptidyl-prolyl cis-trans isomerase
MRRTPATPTPPASDLEQQLSVIREEKQALQSELRGLQQALTRLESQDGARLEELQQRIGDLESRREAAHRQVEVMRSSLQEATDRQANTIKRIETLEGQLEQEHQEQRVALQEVADQQASHTERVETLEGRLQQEYREHTAALHKATEQQASTANRVETLEGRLEREYREHRAALQEALIREQRQNRRLNLAMGLAGFAFLLGTLAGIAELWDVRNQEGMLAELRNDIREIKTLLAQSLNSLSGSAGESPVARPAGAENGTAPALAGTGQLSVTEPLSDRTDMSPGEVSPSYAFHPHTQHRSKSEMQAFFEENARQEGVIGLASGLQYKVLERGIGQSPKTSDKVVFDYRAYLPDGTELYNTYDEPQPATFRVDQVVNPGLQEALQRMEEGAQWELYIPPALAYRGGTRKHRKYGYEPLIYIVELKSVIEGGEAGNEN